RATRTTCTKRGSPVELPTAGVLLEQVVLNKAKVTLRVGQGLGAGVTDHVDIHAEGQRGILRGNLSQTVTEVGVSVTKSDEAQVREEGVPVEFTSVHHRGHQTVLAVVVKDIDINRVTNLHAVEAVTCR